MTVRYIELQPPTKLTGDREQDARDAADLLETPEVVIQVRKPKLGTTGQIVLQTSVIRDNRLFVDVSTTPAFSLSSTENDVGVLVAPPARFLRWRAENVAGDPVFQIDLVARSDAP